MVFSSIRLTRALAIQVTSISPDGNPTNFDYPDDNGNQPLAGDGTPLTVTLDGSAATTPSSIVSVTADNSQYSALTNQTFASGMTYPLPSTWTDTTTVPFEATGLPSAITSIKPTLDSLSGGFTLRTGNGQEADVADGSASSTATLVPVGDHFRYGFVLQTADAQETFISHSAQPPTNVTLAGDLVAPFIKNALVTTTPLGVSWTVAAEGATASADGYVLITTYEAAGNQPIMWITILPPDTTSWIVPTLPNELATQSPVGAADFSTTVVEVSSDQWSSYEEFRAAAPLNIENLVNNDTTWLGTAAICFAGTP